MQYLVKLVCYSVSVKIVHSSDYAQHNSAIIVHGESISLRSRIAYEVDRVVVEDHGKAMVIKVHAE
jgi:hypothetical protein